jgi:hypothetical protein
VFTPFHKPQYTYPYGRSIDETTTRGLGFGSVAESDGGRGVMRERESGQRWGMMGGAGLSAVEGEVAGTTSASVRDGPWAEFRAGPLRFPRPFSFSLFLFLFSLLVF